MAYIGKTPTVGNFQKCDALTASATADYTLQVGSSNVSPESVNHMIVSLNGVIQSPTTAYTVSGSTLSFASALTSNDTIDFVILLGNVLDIGTPSDDTVATAKIQDDAVSLAKMASGTDGNIISYDTSGNPVAVATGNDGQVLTSSGAGAVCAFEDAAGGDNTPAFAVTNSGNQDLSDATYTLVTWDSEVLDTDSAFASNTFTVPSGEGGYYNIFSQVNVISATNNRLIRIKIAFYLNGSIDAFSDRREANTYYQDSIFLQKIYNLSATDTLKVYVYIDDSDNNNPDILGGSNYNTVFGGYKLIT